MIKSVLKLSFAGLAVLAAGASGGCLTRPVSPNEPTTKVNVNSRLKQQAVDKIDLLLAIDNSSSMGDKQKFLASAVPQLVERLVTPNCVKADGTIGGPSTLNQLGEGECSDGEGFAPEFKPITDIHIGIVSSSLGNFGNEDNAVCVTANADDHAQLLARSNPAVDKIENGNFLAWFPDVQKNDGKTPPGRPYTDSNELSSSFAALVSGVGEVGCGLEAQLESVYQFLIAPQPWDKIVVPDPQGSGKAEYSGINTTVLKQRHDFLRPDSLVAVIMLTDEDDSSADPLSVGATGHYFMANSFPGGTDRGDGSRTAAKGTSVCETDPGSDACTSCAFAGSNPDVAADPNCANGAGYYAADDDDLNVRFFKMKQRFGVDPQYSVLRYVKGLSATAITSRELEEHNNGKPDNDASCVNPLFYGGELPTDGTDTPDGLKALCKLPASAESRDPNLVFFALVGGIPNELIDRESGNRDEDNNVTADAWTKIIGADPLAYDYSGQDSRMLQSITPRDGRPAPGSADAPENDPLNKGHRDWDTKKGDLQYACTFPLPEDFRRPANNTGDCKKDSDSPLCGSGPKNVDRVQERAKAYPTIREAIVVRQLGSQGIIGSLCPKVVDGDPNNPEYGYNPAVNEIVDRLKNALTQTCLPQALSKDDNGNVPCLMLEVMPEGVTSCELEGRENPDAEVLTKFTESLDASQKSRTVCVLGQNPGAGSVDGCQQGTGENAGWCYLDGDAAGRCSQQVVFNDRILALAKGSTVYLQCISQYSPQTAASSSSGEATGDDQQ